MAKPDTQPPGVSGKDLSEAFREAFRCHPAGVAIVTADPGDGPVALTVSSLISVSAEPPLVAFSLSNRSSTAAAMLKAESVVIHLTRFDDLELAQLAATSGADRFGPGIAWEQLPTGEPRYTAIATWFRARLRGTLPLDGATLVAAELLDGAVAPSGAQPERDSLVYMDRRWHRLREPDESTE
ncbi:flavin reductase family protein [Pararhodobacter sp.]|uniref:flavin reductase family protein n=1 Tax=Pararhodobacter sp. TaxID=2127056 RepID=UPI002FDE8EFF